MFHPFCRPVQPAGPIEYLIVGLGNPGRKYETTRHNAGFLAVDRLAERHHAKIDRIKFKAVCADAQIAGVRCLLMKPQTFMNLSGEAVRDAAAFYKIPPQRVVVLFDDISLPPGRLRVRRKGSDGGAQRHQKHPLLVGFGPVSQGEIGVGAKPRPEYDLADWVLSGFTKEEGEALSKALDAACDAAELLVQGKTDEAMNRCNGFVAGAGGEDAK